jgi:hypothetical protein
MKSIFSVLAILISVNAFGVDFNRAFVVKNKKDKDTYRYFLEEGKPSVELLSTLRLECNGEVLVDPSVKTETYGVKANGKEIYRLGRKETRYTLRYKNFGSDFEHLAYFQIKDDCDALKNALDMNLDKINVRVKLNGDNIVGIQPVDKFRQVNEEAIGFIMDAQRSLNFNPQGPTELPSRFFENTNPGYPIQSEDFDDSAK